MSSAPTEELARFAAGFRLDDAPASTRDFVRNWLLDSIASALAGDRGDETPKIASFARAIGGSGESSVIGHEERLSLLGATMLNAWQITAVTVCDTYVPAHVHISPEIIPPALAIAERDGKSGRDLLAAVSIGAEIAVRVAMGINYKVAGPRGWHFPGIVGPFGAAAAVGHLTGLSPLQMRNAFGIAGSQAAGTWASWGSPAVKFHQTRGAASGVLAALLAAEDFTASAEILTHPDGGMVVAYSDGGKPEAILEGLGRTFELEAISLRPWPGATPLQPLITAVFDLIATHRPAIDEIERIRVIVSPRTHDDHLRYARPKGTFEALLSPPFIVASSLRDRKFWLDSLDPENVADPELNRFMERIELVADESHTYDTGAVELFMLDGRKLAKRIDHAKGTKENPASLADLTEKFERCVAGRLSDPDTAELLDLLIRLDEVTDLSRLLALLRSARRRN